MVPLWPVIYNSLLGEKQSWAVKKCGGACTFLNSFKKFIQNAGDIVVTKT